MFPQRFLEKSRNSWIVEYFESDIRNRKVLTCLKEKFLLFNAHTLTHIRYHLTHVPYYAIFGKLISLNMLFSNFYKHGKKNKINLVL